MRLIGTGAAASLLAADVSASLRGLGRGDHTIGGIALMNVTPHGFARPFDAVVVMPHGVLLIVGVELPGPTMRLDAPLHGQWKADNWPLVGSGDAVNPGAHGLAASQRLAQRIAEEARLTVPIATMLAVGPFVDAVVPSRDDLSQPVRVLHPTINALTDAIATLTPPGGPTCSAEQARAVLRAIDPATPIQPDDTLATEGFPSTATTARTGPGPAPVQPPPSAPSRGRPALLRPLPIAVVFLLVVGLIAVIAVTTAGASNTPARAGSPQRMPDLVVHQVDGLDFEVVAADTDRDCESTTYGDLRTTVSKADCAGVHLGSYLTSVGGRRAAVSVAEFELESHRQAGRLEKLVSTPGTGWAIDLATTRDAWPDTSGYGAGTYRSAEADGRLRLVRTVWLDGPGPDDGDATLGEISDRAFAVPMPNLR